MSSNINQNLRNEVVEAYDKWAQDGTPANAELLRELESERISIRPEEVPFIIESVYLAIVTLIQAWECEEQGGEGSWISFTCMEMPICREYQKCIQLLNWAKSNGVGDRICEVHDLLRMRCPSDTDGLFKYMQCHNH